MDVFHLKDGIAGYMTRVIHSLGEESNTLLAPGFVGWLYVVAGLPAIILGSIATGVLSVIGWKFLDRRYIETGPVAQVFFLWMLFIALTEGTLDSMIHMLVVGLTTMVILEAGLRVLTRKERRENFNS
jgi:hypothetical protein